MGQTFRMMFADGHWCGKEERERERTNSNSVGKSLRKLRECPIVKRKKVKRCMPAWPRKREELFTKYINHLDNKVLERHS
jgi:hypothetical protein